MPGIGLENNGITDRMTGEQDAAAASWVQGNQS